MATNLSLADQLIAVAATPANENTVVEKSVSKRSHFVGTSICRVTGANSVWHAGAVLVTIPQGGEFRMSRGGRHFSVMMDLGGDFPFELRVYGHIDDIDPKTLMGATGELRIVEMRNGRFETVYAYARLDIPHRPRTPAFELVIDDVPGTHEDRVYEAAVGDHFLKIRAFERPKKKRWQKRRENKSPKKQ